MRRLPLALLLIIAACGPTTPPQVAPPPPVAPPAPAPIGLTRVLSHTSAEAQALLGAPTLDRIEGKGRQLQFARGTCVLDLFLYPPTPDAEPRVKSAAARRRDGGPLDAASCLQSQVIARRGDQAPIPPPPPPPGRRRR